jgi:N12 class adenine-specific DNA methylase
VNTGVHYAPNSDEYSVKTDYRTIAISDKYAVQGEFGKYDGVSLLKHALNNATPNIGKPAKATDRDGREITVKVRDGEKIQLANSKIDEFRSGFTDWLNQQTPEFKQRLTDLYNRRFNCFVRPQYDGSHRTFPNPDLKAPGIPDLYQSQKDCIRMQKLLGGESPYPNAKILYPGKEDFTPKNRIKIFNEIRTSNRDAVIVTHDQSGMIDTPVPGKHRNKFRKENCTADFKTMGTDHVFVDESHYPNLDKILTLFYNYLINSYGISCQF